MNDDDREQFAMIPLSVILRCRDAGCLRLYAYLDFKSYGKFGKPVGGYNYLAGVLGVQARTVEQHAEHLRDAGLITITREGRGQVMLKVVHNPARGVFAENVELPERRARYRHTSNIRDYFARDDAAPVPRKTRHPVPRKTRYPDEECAADNAAHSFSTNSGVLTLRACDLHGIVECLDCPQIPEVESGAADENAELSDAPLDHDAAVELLVREFDATVVAEFPR